MLTFFHAEMLPYERKGCSEFRIQTIIDGKNTEFRRTITDEELVFEGVLDMMLKAFKTRIEEAVKNETALHG